MATAPVGGLLLFHGAGGDRNHHTFLALDDRLNLPVARIDFPYRRKGPGRRPPDRMPKLVEAVEAAATECAAAWQVPVERLVLGGRSMGGRVASLAIAGGQPAAGLLLLSYPLHPPGKPDKLRVDHFDRITTPVLVIHGTRDPFGTVDELTGHLAAIPAPVETSWIDANHDPKHHDDHIVATVSGWLHAAG